MKYLIGHLNLEEVLNIWFLSDISVNQFEAIPHLGLAKACPVLRRKTTTFINLPGGGGNVFLSRRLCDVSSAVV